MRFRLLACLVLLPALSLAADAPKTPQKPASYTLHGVTLNDPYQWLEDQKSPETRAWIEQQARFTEAYLAALPGRDTLRKRLEPMFRVDSYGMPVERGGTYFFSRRLKNENRASIVMRAGLAGKDEVLIAPGDVSADESVSVSILRVSDDGGLLLYAVRRGGEDETEIRFYDVKSRKTLPGVMPRSRWFGVALHPDNKRLWYSRMAKEGTGVYLHQIGKPMSEDVFVFSRGKGLVPTDSVSLSEDGRYLVLTVNYGTSSKNEVRFVDLASGGTVVSVVDGIDAQFRVAVHDGFMFLHTNWKAPNWRLLKLSLASPKLEEAQEIIPERDAALTGVSYTGRRIYADYLENVQPKIRVFDVNGAAQGEFAAPGAGVMSAPSGRWKAAEAFFSFSSFAEPSTTYRVDLATGKRDIWHKTKIAVDSASIEVKQVWYASKDGTRVPMWLVYKRGLKLDGNRPVLLTGYGGFNLSRLATFTPTAALWADFGGVYALPNLRGGGEFGEKWHKAAMFGNKQNTFDDFIAAAEWLVANKFTKPSRIAVSGGSNGGLLVGAMLTQRPDLVGAVLCSVPLLDMVRYQNTLLGRFWISEYGSSENPEQFKYLLKYSPYHNVEKGAKYPAVMFSSGDSDTRVDPMHARKMTALVQASSASGNPVLLHYDTKAGHSGGKPVEKMIEDVADEQLFLLNSLGVDLN